MTEKKDNRKPWLAGVSRSVGRWERRILGQEKRNSDSVFRFSIISEFGLRIPIFSQFGYRIPNSEFPCVAFVFILPLAIFPFFV